MVTNKIFFTREGYAKLKADLAGYYQKREGTLVRLQLAREQGDLSENGAYKAARFELGDIDRNIRRLATLIKYGVVNVPSGHENIGFGNTVFLEKDGGKIEYLLVSKHESDPVAHKLSLESPLGQALMGKKVGDEVVAVAPAGVMRYKIVKIR